MHSAHVRSALTPSTTKDFSDFLRVTAGCCTACEVACYIFCHRGLLRLLQASSTDAVLLSELCGSHVRTRWLQYREACKTLDLPSPYPTAAALSAEFSFRCITIHFTRTLSAHPALRQLGEVFCAASCAFKTGQVFLLEARQRMLVRCAVSSMPMKVFRTVASRFSNLLVWV